MSFSSSKNKTLPQIPSFSVECVPLKKVASISNENNPLTFIWEKPDTNTTIQDLWVCFQNRQGSLNITEKYREIPNGHTSYFENYDPLNYGYSHVHIEGYTSDTSEAVVLCNIPSLTPAIVEWTHSSEKRENYYRMITGDIKYTPILLVMYDIYPYNMKTSELLNMWSSQYQKLKITLWISKHTDSESCDVHATIIHYGPQSKDL